MLRKNEKLTMVSVVFNGRRKVVFTKGFIQPDGKTTVPKSVIDRLFYELCGFDRSNGLTYSIGS